MHSPFDIRRDRLAARPMRALAALLGAAALLAACGDDIQPVSPGITNLPPVAVVAAYPDEAVPGQAMTLDGSASFDPEHRPLIAYAWNQVSGTPVALSATDTSYVTFTVPDSTTVLGFELVVTDEQESESTPARVDIAVTAGSGTQPPPAQDSVFVSATGSDAAGRSGSHLQPARTIGRALQIAAQKGYSTLYVMEGTYTEEVIPSSNVTLHGCVTGVAADGTPQFSADPAKTVIAAPAGKAQAITVAAASKVTIECFTVRGASTPGTARAVAIDGSQQVTLRNIAVFTPGAALATCRDVVAADSDAVAIIDSRFESSGICKDYAAIDADGIAGLTIADNGIAFANGGVEGTLKGITVVNSTSVRLEGNDLQTAGAIAPAAVLTGIAAADAPGIAVAGNRIFASGGDALTGVSLRCTGVVADAAVEENAIEAEGAATQETGIGITCAQDNADFAVRRNRIRLQPAGGAAAAVRGIYLTTLLRPVTFAAVNNVIVLPTAANDQAAKTGISIPKLGAASAVSAVHNTMLVTGNAGELYALASDRTDVQFSLTNNVALVYGANGNNALLSLPALCATTHCARGIEGNLINANFGAKDLALAFYRNTSQFELLSTANECDQNPAPLACSLNVVDHRANVLQQNLKPAYFDFTAGELLAAYQHLAMDSGLAAGVATDIDGAARSDGQPDIGATEY